MTTREQIPHVLTGCSGRKVVRLVGRYGVGRLNAARTSSLEPATERASQKNYRGQSHSECAAPELTVIEPEGDLAKYERETERVRVNCLSRVGMRQEVGGSLGRSVTGRAPGRDRRDTG